MRGRRNPKIKPHIVIVEDDEETRKLYSENLREFCEITFLTTREEVSDFRKITDFKTTNIQCFVFDGYFREDKFKLSSVIYAIKNRGYIGPIVAASEDRNNELAENGATNRPEGDLKENVPSLVLEILGLD